MEVFTMETENTKRGPSTVMVPADLGATIVAYKKARQLSTNSDAIRHAFMVLAQKEGLNLPEMCRIAGFHDQFIPLVETR